MQMKAVKVEDYKVGLVMNAHKIIAKRKYRGGGGGDAGISRL